MEFGPFVNALWASLPKPFQWARQLLFRRVMKVEVKSTEAGLSQQTLDSDKMNNPQDDTATPRRPESTVCGAAWLVFLLSIIPVVVLTLSC